MLWKVFDLIFEIFFPFYSETNPFLLQFCIISGVTLTLISLIVTKHSRVQFWETGHVFTSDDMDVEKGCLNRCDNLLD
jgi:hypothetical protein